MFKETWDHVLDCLSLFDVMSSEALAPQEDPSSGGTSSQPSPTPAEVRAELTKVQNSDPFVRSQRIRQLLEFLVEGVLAGNHDQLKESLIGVGVFDRSPSYDCKQDPVVRVEMRRLRSKLSEYYLHDGKSDEVLIWLEKGSYVPALSRQAPAGSTRPATPETETAIEPSGESAVLPPVQSRRNPRQVWIVGAFTILLIAVALGIYFGRSNASQPLRVFPLAGNAGLESSPAFSPDGKQVAYSWDGNRNNFDIYVKSIDGGIPRRLTDNAAHDINPAWSVDGNQIAFLRVFPEKTRLMTVPSAGGVEKVIAEFPPSVNRWHPEEPEGNGAGGPVWSSDGSYFVVTGPPPEHPVGVNPFALLKIHMDGRVEALTVPPLQVGDVSPRISPSGHYVAFTRTWRVNSGDIHVMPSTGGQPVRLTFDSRNIQGLAWLDDHNIVFSSNRGGNFHLWQISRSGGSPQPFSAAGTQPTWPAISRDGHRFAFVEAVNEASIWRLGLTGQAQAPQGEAFITSAADDSSPAYSPDGKKIAFISRRTGAAQIWISDSDGLEVRQLSNFEGSSINSPRWSPDSRRLAFDGVVKDLTSIWLIDADGSNLHRLNNISATEFAPTWSRDGKWIYFCSLRSGKNQLWKQAPETGQALQLTQLPFIDATESADGRTLYLQRARGGLWRMPINGGSPEPVPELANSDLGRYWTLEGDTVYFVRREQLAHQLESFNLTTRRSQELAIIPSALMAGPSISVDPDQRWLLFVQRNQRRSTILLQER